VIDYVLYLTVADYWLNLRLLQGPVGVFNKLARSDSVNSQPHNLASRK